MVVIVEDRVCGWSKGGYAKGSRGVPGRFFLCGSEGKRRP